MNYKKQILLLFSISILWILFGIIVLCQPTDPNWMCQKDPPELVQATTLFFFAFFPLCVLLYFLKEAAYLSWRKFALRYLLVVAVILMLSANNGGGNGFNPGYGFDTESLTFFFSGLFFLVSLLLIIIKSWKLRGK